MFIRKRTHDAAITARDAIIANRDYSLTTARETLSALRAETESLREAAYGADRTAAMYKKLYEGACKRLSEIAALETPGCAHVGKRLARMARAELPLLHHSTNGAAAQAVVS